MRPSARRVAAGADDDADVAMGATDVGTSGVAVFDDAEAGEDEDVVGGRSSAPRSRAITAPHGCVDPTSARR